MTKDEALDLALEALEKMAKLTGARWALEQGYAGHLEAITAIKQARSAPVQKPYRPLQDNGSQYFGDSWDTPPAQPAPVQEPVWNNLPSNKDVEDAMRMKRLNQLAIAAAVPDAFGTREGEHPQYIQGWNDCRAEMLRGMKP
jgi:hypothetical protein